MDAEWNEEGPQSPRFGGVWALGVHELIGLLLLACCRERLRLLLEHLCDGSAALDRELLHLAVRRGRELVEECTDLVHVLRLEERLEVVVRETNVLLHERLVRSEKLHDLFDLAGLTVERGKDD